MIELTGESFSKFIDDVKNITVKPMSMKFLKMVQKSNQGKNSKKNQKKKAAKKAKAKANAVTEDQQSESNTVNTESNTNTESYNQSDSYSQSQGSILTENTPQFIETAKEEHSNTFSCQFSESKDSMDNNAVNESDDKMKTEFLNTNNSTNADSKEQSGEKT